MERLDYSKVAPRGMNALRNLQAYIDSCGLEHPLLELVKARASQINGCAYWLDMHTKDARGAGESEQRFYLLSAWREAPFYSEREHAAFAIEDDLYEEVRRYFNEREIIDLTLAVIAINACNRLAIPFRTPAGSYQPARSPNQTRGVAS